MRVLILARNAKKKKNWENSWSEVFDAFHTRNTAHWGKESGKIVKILLIKNLVHYPTKDFEIVGQYWNSFNFLDIQDNE